MLKIRWRIEFLVYKLVTFPFVYSPQFIRKSVGKSLATLFYYISSRHRKTTLRNLEIAFPEKDLKWRIKTAKNSYRFFGKMMADVISFNRLKTNGLKKLISKIEGEENIRKPFENGRGAICMASHFGNWEMLSLGASAAGYKVAVVARYSDNPLLEKELHRSRTTTGGVVIYKNNAIKNMIRYLKNGYLIGFLMDQNQIDQEGIFIDVFGVKACATPTHAMLALKYDFPVVPSYCIPDGKKKYKLVFDTPIEIKKTGDFKKDIHNLTQKCSLYLEDLIRQYPEYWLWMHKRWNTRPKGDRPIY